MCDDNALPGMMSMFALIHVQTAVFWRVSFGLEALRTEAVLQTLLVFLGFNVAWLLFPDDKQPSRPWPRASTE